MSGDRDRDGGLRVGPWVPPPRAPNRRGRHAAAAPVPAPDPAEPITQRLPVDAAPVPPGPTGRLAGGGWFAGGRRFSGGPWLVVAAVVVTLAVVVVVPLVATRGPHGPTASGPAGGASPAVLPVPVASGSAADPARSATPSPSRSPSHSASPSRAGAPAPGPASIAIEAEDPRNTLGGSAWVDTYPGASGGRIVRNIGIWNGSSKHAGWLRFNGVTPPAAGTYLLTFYAVHLDDAANRTIVVTVSGADPVSVAVTASATCCTAVRLRITLQATGNTITFTNTDGHAPSIDRIVISAG